MLLSMDKMRDMTKLTRIKSIVGYTLSIQCALYSIQSSMAE